MLVNYTKRMVNNMSKENEFVLYLIAEERNTKTTICFKEDYSQEVYDKWLNIFKNDNKVKKIFTIRDDVEEVLLER